MAAPPSLLADREEAVHRTRHRAAHEQEIALGVHFDDPQAQLGEAPRAHMARHALSLDDARGVGARGDRARLAVTCVAVRLRPTPEVMAVHHALEAAPLRHPRDLHPLARLEDGDGDRLARLGRLRPRPGYGEALEHAGRDLEARPLHVAQQCARSALELPRPEAELDPVPGDLHHGTGARLDHRYRHRRALRVEDARHPELPADQSGHPYSTLISTSTPAGRSSFVSASTVWERVSMMSISRLWVFSSNCSRLFLSMCGLRSTVHSCRLVGNGMGPETCAPVFSAVRTMSAAAWSISAWSNALRRIRILPAIGPLLENLRDHAGAH